MERIASIAPRFLLAVPLLALGDLPEVEPVRHATCLRYFSLEGDVKPDLLRRAVAELSAIDAEAKLVVGPLGVSSKPKYRFVALELPVGTAAKDVEKAMRKASPKTIELAWTAFQGKDRELPAILGFNALECVVGMDNDIRWFALEGGLARFFYLPGKMDEKELRSRFAKLYQPFNAEELGELVRERIAWKLADPVDPSAVKAAEKALGKLPGIVKPRIDATSRTLVADVVYDGLRAAAAVGAAAGGSSVPEGRFLPDEALDALAAAKVSLAAGSDASGK